MNADPARSPGNGRELFGGFLLSRVVGLEPFAGLADVAGLSRLTKRLDFGACCQASLVKSPSIWIGIGVRMQV